MVIKQNQIYIDAYNHIYTLKWQKRRKKRIILSAYLILYNCCLFLLFFWLAGFVWGIICSWHCRLFVHRRGPIQALPALKNATEISHYFTLIKLSPNYLLFMLKSIALFMDAFFCPFMAAEDPNKERKGGKKRTEIKNGRRFTSRFLLSFVFVRLLCVTLVFSTKGQRYLRVGMAVPLFGSVACLRRMVADEGKLSPDQVTLESNRTRKSVVRGTWKQSVFRVFAGVILQVILTEVYSTGFHRSFFDEDDLTCIAENDVIYAFQAPPRYIRGGSARVSGSCGNWARLFLTLKVVCHLNKTKQNKKSGGNARRQLSLWALPHKKHLLQSWEFVMFCQVTSHKL